MPKQPNIVPFTTMVKAKYEKLATPTTPPFAKDEIKGINAGRTYSMMQLGKIDPTLVYNWLEQMNTVGLAHYTEEQLSIFKQILVKSESKSKTKETAFQPLKPLK